MDSRIALPSGTTLRFFNKAGGAVVFIIVREIGRGGSCIVYDAVYTANTDDVKHIRIKECYPYKLQIERTENGCLKSADNALFENAKEKFKSDFSIGNGLFYSGDLFDALANTIDIYFGNGTVYLASEYSTENTLASYRPKSLKDCITVVRQVACILQKIHNEGYLYLDIKPDNILIIDSLAIRVQLFDLDSLIPLSMCDKQNINIVRPSYSKGFAAIELQTEKLKKLGAHTDVYAVGALLFWLLFKRTPGASDCESNAVFDYSKAAFEKSEYQDKLFFRLTDFFHNALANFYLDRFQSIQPAIEALEEIERLADIYKPFIRSTEITVPVNFIGRENELDTLCKWIEESESKCIFVTGMGGIGKSTLVRSALVRCKSCVDNILYLSFDESLPKTLSDDRQAFINTVSKNDAESAADYYERKLRAFSEIAAEAKTILVIDNYSGALDKNVCDVLNVGWKVIFISRKEPVSGDYLVLPITAISKQTDLQLLFESNLKNAIRQADILYMNNIIAKVAGHTLTVELIAKQIAGSYLTIAQASALVDKYGFSEIASERVVFSKDNIEHTETIRGIITALFEAECLTEKMKSILKTMSLIGNNGIDVRLLCSIIETESTDDVNSLIRDGWIQLSGTDISLHPVIKETIHCLEWSDEAKRYAEMLLKYLFCELKTEGRKEGYPHKLTEIIECNNKQMKKHPQLEKRFEKITDKTGVIGETLCERYAHSDNRASTDREKAAGLVSLAEEVLDSSKREPFLLDTDIYSDLLYLTIQNMPRYREEFILARSEELILNPKSRNGFALMKLYDCIIEIYLERGDFETAAEKLLKAGHTAKQFGSNYIYALYYDMLSGYYDNLLGGAYDAVDTEEKLILKKLNDAIDKTISYSRKTRNNYGQTLLAKNLLAKATILIRNPQGKKLQIDRTLSEAQRIVLTEEAPCSEVRGIYYSVCAWYFTLIEPSLENTEKCMAKAREIFTKTAPTDLDEIDCISIPCADMYCLWECYARSAKLLMEAIEICEKNEPVVPYIRKKLELFGYLLDVCYEWGKYDLCRAVIGEIDAMNDKYCSLGIHKEISEELRLYIDLSK